MGMGEQKLRAKQFTQKTDEVTDEVVKQEDLFSNTAVEADLAYECIRHPEGEPVSEGLKVRILDMKDEILVFRGTQMIGCVAPSQQEILRSNVSLGHRIGRAINGTVIEVSEITPTFFVLVKG
ncbi:MAG: hypothetical protein JWM16_3469 [Verrucomicrobiales bacterium]|nr:hypothetical protein [Verrucomicrobiales bacterium]